MSLRTSVGFVSLGCPKNLVDTERMIQLLASEGATITGSENNADIVVVNTCGFLEPAKKESMDTIGEFVELKRAKKIKGVVVTGCMTERYLSHMSAAYPEVDAFLQTKDFSKITEVVREISLQDLTSLERRRALLGEVVQLEGHSELEDFVQRGEGKRSYAYLKIAEGCNRVCSFCIIPKLRGKLHSRSIAGIVDEAHQLAAQGTKELILIAQDLTSYGRDLGEGKGLLELLKALEDVPGIEWIRPMYNYPRFFGDELIEFLASSTKFARYLDIPFQHFSAGVLKQMRRPESPQEIRSLVEKLRVRIPDLSLRTTFMVGFPGETDEDFQELLKFVGEGHFDHVGTFTFYREAGTPSFDMPDQVSEEVKVERYSQLMKLQQKIQRSKLKRWESQVLDVNIDGFQEKTKQGLVFRGRHRGQAPDIDGMTFVLTEDQPLEIGDMVKVVGARRIGDYDLIGVLDEESALDVKPLDRTKRASLR